MRKSLTPNFIALTMWATLSTVSAVGIAWGGTDVGNGMPVGMTRGQTARLNVLQPPDPVTPPDPCQVELMFFDSMGNRLAESMETVSPGRVRFLDLDGDEALQDRKEQRLQIYTLVATARAERRACRNLVATLEIFDSATGKTIVILTLPGPV